VSDKLLFRIDDSHNLQLVTAARMKELNGAVGNGNKDKNFEQEIK
jgi:hypothetical protein